jgi:alpha-beta hydrolase superfamily lysophospholipase
VALVHGFGEHILRYDELGIWLARRDSAVFGFDQRGHGRSAGARGHVERFDQYLDDLAEFLDCVRAEAPGLPVHLVGHSRGGLVVSAFARERQPELSSVVTSGAALALSSELSRLKVILARALRLIAPRLAMDAGIDPAGLSTDPQVTIRYREDPNVHGRMTASHAVEMMNAIERTRAQGGRVQLPMLLMHGQDDPLCLPAGSEEFHASLPGASGGSDAPAAELRIYPGLRHEIFNEPEREKVYCDLLEWILRVERGEAKAG